MTGVGVGETTHVEELTVRLCGFFAIERADGTSLRPTGKKPAALLAYLAYQRGKGVTRDRLIDLLWSDRGQKQGQDSLRQAVYVIRQALGRRAKSFIVSHRNYLAVDPEQISYDLWRQDGSINEHIHDRFLEDMDFISPVFDDWLAQTRRDVCNKQISRSERLLVGVDVATSPEKALQIAHTILKLDDTNEPAARTAIQIHANQDEIGHSRRIFLELRKRLTDDGLDVSEKTQNLFRRIAGSSPEAVRSSQSQEISSEPSTEADLPMVEVAVLRKHDDRKSSSDLSEEFFDRLVSRMVPMPEVRVRALQEVEEASGSAFSLRLLPSIKGDDTRMVVRLSSGNGEAFWASGPPITLQFEDEKIDAQVDMIVAQVIAAIEESVYRKLNGKPTTAYEHYVVAQRLFRAPTENDYMDKVVDHLQRSLELDPDFLPTIERLVKFYNTGGFMSRPGTDHTKPRKKAYKLAQRLLFLNSQYPTAHVRMASCLLWQGKFESAERSARRAIELKPYDPYALNVLGTALVYLGDLDAAETCYGMAEERLTNDMDFVRTDYGELFYLKREFEIALSWLESPEVRTPYRTLFWRVPTLAQLDRIPESRRDVEDMIEDLRKRWCGTEPFQPEVGIQWMCDMKPYRCKSHRDLLVDGFNKAGVKITAKNFP